MGLYTEAADIITKVRAKKASVKTLVLGKSTYPNKKQLYALVCETIKHIDILKQVEAKIGLLEKESVLEGNESLLLVLLYDQLIGRGIKGSHNYRVPVQRYRSQLKSEYKKLRTDQCFNGEVEDNQRTKVLPRYVRVNLIKTTADDVVRCFEEEGWILVDANCQNKNFKDTVQSLNKSEFLKDPDLSDVLVFPSGTDFHDHPLVKSGEIILQDKASCFPGHILSPPEGAVVIDCCAAPGNKTSHLGSLMGNTGKIYAFDKSSSRLGTMSSLLSIAGVTSAEVKNEDFLRVNPHNAMFQDVGYVLVDPSCSGSGMADRVGETINKDRLASLSKFQISILKHALKFPAVKKVVYSTCSIHEEENEAVVEEVMSQFKGQFTLVEVFPDWPNRGVKGYPCWKECMRMSHDQNLTNGFFVACFEKVIKGQIANTSDGSECGETLATQSETNKKHHKKKKKKRKMEESEVECGNISILASETKKICKEIESEQFSYVRNGEEKVYDDSIGEEENVKIKKKKHKKKKSKEKTFEIPDMETDLNSVTVDKNCENNEDWNEEIEFKKSKHKKKKKKKDKL